MERMILLLTLYLFGTVTVSGEGLGKLVFCFNSSQVCQVRRDTSSPRPDYFVHLSCIIIYLKMRQRALNYKPCLSAHNPVSQLVTPTYLHFSNFDQ